MTSGQAAAQPQSPHKQHQSYDWSNIATIRRSTSIKRNNAAGDRYPKYGDPLRFSRDSQLRPGSTEMGINAVNETSYLYPHLEERPTTHNLRSTKSEFFLAPPSPSHYQRSIRLSNIDDDTKWITSSTPSTASYHSGYSSSRENYNVNDEGTNTDDDSAHLCSELVKPVSLASLPPLDRGLPYRNYSRLGGSSNSNYYNTDDTGSSSTIYQQTQTVGVVGENDLAPRNVQTTPPPPSMIPSMLISSHINAHPQPQPPRKYFTLNPPRTHRNVGQHHNSTTTRQLTRGVDRYYNSNGRNNQEEDLRRRSMTPMPTSFSDMIHEQNPNHFSQGNVASQLNRAQSCYVDPLDYKVGCQNTLRSKPLIPWYELAIKDSNRRSCPQFEVYK